MAAMITLRVRIEPRIPKLLVKINPEEAEGFAVKSLEEVTLKKVAASRGHVAVLHMNQNVAPGELLMSLKLAEILDIQEDDTVQVSSNAQVGAGRNSGRGVDKSECKHSSVAGACPQMPMFDSRAFTTAGNHRCSLGGMDSLDKERPLFQKDGRYAGSFGMAGEPDLSKPIRGTSFDFNLLHDLEREQASWRYRDRDQDGTCHTGCAIDAELDGLWNRWVTNDGRPLSPADRLHACHEEFTNDLLRPRGHLGKVNSNHIYIDIDAQDADEFVPRRRQPLGGLGNHAEQETNSRRRQNSFTSAFVRYAADSDLDPHDLSQPEADHVTCADHLPGSKDLLADVPLADPMFTRYVSPDSQQQRWRYGFGENAEQPCSRARADANSSAGRTETGCLDVPEACRLPASNTEAWNCRRRSDDREGNSSNRCHGPQCRSAPVQSDRWSTEQSAYRDLGGTSWTADDELRTPGFATDLESDEVMADLLGFGRSQPGLHQATGPTANGRATFAGAGPLPECLMSGMKATDPSVTPQQLKAGWQEMESSNWGDESPNVRAAPAHVHRDPELSGPRDKSTGCLSGSVWDTPTPQRSGLASVVAESLESSPAPSPASRQGLHASSSRAFVVTKEPHDRQGEAPLSTKRHRAPAVREWSPPQNAASGSSSPPTSTSPRVRNVRASSSSSPREERCTHDRGRAPAMSPEVTRPTALPMVLVPAMENGGGNNSNSNARRSTSTLRRKSMTLGALQPDDDCPPVTEARQRAPLQWQAPSGGNLERSELGIEVTAEVRRWIMGETSGQQCSQVVLDRALTVLSNFKLASGCQLEVLGGPLGAIVGGYNDADWLYGEVFKKAPADAIREAFTVFGCRSRSDGDWSNVPAEEVSLAYRRLCLRGHPSRGGAPRDYLKLQVSMELIRAFSGESGPLQPASRPLLQNSSSHTRSSGAGFVLDDLTLLRELQLTAAQADEEAGKLPQDQLEEMNRALDEYILRQMCFKSEIVDEIARLHEDSAYAILGVSSGATDAEIKRAYRLIAMQCHPDKGGDKEDFQELNNAYEKIMEQRRSVGDDKWPQGGSDDSDQDAPGETEGKKPKARTNSSKPSPDDPAATKSSGEEGCKETDKDERSQAEEDANPDEACSGDDEYKEEDSNASLVEKAGKAAEEASRYAKTAAEFAHQAAEAADTARKNQEQGSRDALTKSVSHSAIVLTLTVVKAVRVVGYATLDVAAQCRVAAKRNPSATGCADRAVTAMGLGLEALNAALACAEVTEATAAELQAPAPADSTASGSTAAAERFVGAAVRASLAAASASNAAMTAAIAAVEGSRECMKAVESQPLTSGGKASAHGEERTSKEGEEADNEDEAETTEATRAEEQETQSKEAPAPSKEEVAKMTLRRLVAQRNNNHKVLQRLNAEILSHQQNVRKFLQDNRQLIPTISGEAKTKVFKLLKDYVDEAHLDIDEALIPKSVSNSDPNEIATVLRQLPLLVPFLQTEKNSIAIPVSVKARVIKMAALYDLPLAVKVLEDDLFKKLRSALPEDKAREMRKTTDEICSRILEELSNNVAEAVAGAHTPASCGGQTPMSFGMENPNNS